MAQFDVYRLPDGGLILDCQSDLLDDIGTRFVIPLVPDAYAPPVNERLNPSFEVAGETVRMVTQFATAVRTVELRTVVGSIAQDHNRIIGAIDVLTGSG